MSRAFDAARFRGVVRQRLHDSGILEPLTFERLSTALFFVGVACAACFMPAQSDTWWHLRAGEEIWRSRTVALRDTFSHTAYGAYWPDHEWLTQVLFYGLYQAGGLKLLTAVMAGAATVTWIIVGRLTPGGSWLRILLLCLALTSSSIAWSIRPQVLTLLCLALAAFLLHRRRLRWLPLLFLVWANLHGAVLLGLVVLAAATVGTALTDRREAASLLGTLLLCCAATSVTPLGLSFWTEMGLSLGRIDQYQIQEWRRPQLSDPAFLPFWPLALGLVVLVVLQRPWRDPRFLRNPAVCGALAVLPLALMAGRNVPPLMLLAVPAVATLLTAIAGGADGAAWSGLTASAKAPAVRRSVMRRRKALPYGMFWIGRRGSVRTERPIFNAAVLATAMLIALGSVTYAWGSEADRLGWRPLPDAAIAAVASCPERLYNRYGDGGYLIWFVRNHKVFLDGRQDPYPSTLIEEQVRVETSGNYEETFRRYGVRCAFVLADSTVARRLSAAGWRTTYQDGTWEVFVQRTDALDPSERHD
jgi:hypothetical protein